MRQIPMNNSVVKAAAKRMQEAFNSGNEEKMNQAWQAFFEAVSDSVKDDYELHANDEQALAKRGYRQLTSKEKRFYEKFIEAAKSSNPKQAITDLVDVDGGMPETIIEDVYRNLVNEHPLLNAISFTSASYLTKWLISDHTKQSAAWGTINGEISKELQSSFEVLDLTLNKLSCFAVIPKDMLELGPKFLDNYIRTILGEALAVALENAMVTGTGKNMPIGLDRDIHEGVSVSGGEYPKKTAVEVENFLPETYGSLVARLCKTEKGNYRKIEGLSLVCNPVDYYKKVMPATTVLNTNGTYTGNVFPVPTEVYQSTELDEGKAILFLAKEYFMALGTSKTGTITYDDSCQFLEDNRVYIIKAFANGRAFDNTVAVLLDISKLNPAYITVLNKTVDAATQTDDSGVPIV